MVFLHISTNTKQKQTYGAVNRKLGEEELLRSLEKGEEEELCAG
jgi:hypothetical protein